MIKILKRNVTGKISFSLIFGVLILCTLSFGFGAYYVYTNKPSTSKNPTLLTKTTKVTSIPTDDWETYTSAEYSFKHPKGIPFDVNAAATGLESIRFRYMGPKQIESGRTQTSLFDGYFFIITKIESNTEKTPDQLADAAISNTNENCGEEVTVSDIEKLQLSNATGVRYTVRNCLGDYTASYIAHNKNIYEVTQFYVGESVDQSGYEQITNKMFDSLKFAE